MGERRILHPSAAGGGGVKTGNSSERWKTSPDPNLPPRRVSDSLYLDGDSEGLVIFGRLVRATHRLLSTGPSAVDRVAMRAHRPASHEVD